MTNFKKLLSLLLAVLLIAGCVPISAFAEETEVMETESAVETLETLDETAEVAEPEEATEETVEPAEEPETPAEAVEEVELEEPEAPAETETVEESTEPTEETPEDPAEEPEVTDEAETVEEAENAPEEIIEPAEEAESVGETEETDETTEETSESDEEEVILEDTEEIAVQEVTPLNEIDEQKEIKSFETWIEDYEFVLDDDEHTFSPEATLTVFFMDGSSVTITKDNYNDYSELLSNFNISWQKKEDNSSYNKYTDINIGTSNLFNPTINDVYPTAESEILYRFYVNCDLDIERTWDYSMCSAHLKSLDEWVKSIKVNYPCVIYAKSGDTVTITPTFSKYDEVTDSYVDATEEVMSHNVHFEWCFSKDEYSSINKIGNDTSLTIENITDFYDDEKYDNIYMLTIDVNDYEYFLLNCATIEIFDSDLDGVEINAETSKHWQPVYVRKGETLTLSPTITRNGVDVKEELADGLSYKWKEYYKDEESDEDATVVGYADSLSVIGSDDVFGNSYICYIYYKGICIESPCYWVNEDTSNPSVVINCSGDNWPESEHCYSNDMDTIWVYSEPEAESISVKFSSATETESDFDYIYIYDGNDRLVGKYDGVSLSNQTIKVTGNTIKIRLTSDESDSKYGFSISQLVINGDVEETFGTCGENLTWNFYDYTGTLAISGTGDMDSYKGGYAPWDTEYLWKNVESISISEGVTSIGDYAFGGFYNFEDIMIPKSVKYIGESINECWDLSTVIYYNGTMAEFEQILSYTDLSIYKVVCRDGTINYETSGACGENLTWNFDESTGTLTISGTGDMYSFYEDLPWRDLRSKIKNIVVSDGVTSIDYAAFFLCEISNITIPDSVTSIGAYAFSFCTNLSSVTLPKNITTINERLFGNCKTLTNVTIPEKVTLIGNNAFNGCSELTSVTIPKSVTSIEWSAFEGCNDSLEITYASTKADWQKIEGYEHVECKVICTDGVIEATTKTDLSTANVTLSYTSTTYTGKAKKPTVKVTDADGNVLSSDVYTVTYKNNVSAGSASVTVKGDEVNTTGTKTVNFTIKKAAPTVTAPVAKKLTYTGSAQALVTAGKTTGGTLKYCLTSDGTYTTTIPTKTNVGIYKVYYKVVGNTNYNGTTAKYVTVNIVPKKPVISSVTNTSTGIKVTWGKVTGATGYYVYRGTTKIKTLTSGSTVTYTDTAVKDSTTGTKYTYKVYAYYKNSAGTIIKSAVSATKTTYRVKRPAISSYKNTNTGIKITWGKVTGASGYYIYRSDKLIKTLTSGSTVSYTDTAVKDKSNGAKYNYYVKAYYKNSAGTVYKGVKSAVKTAYRVKAPASLTLTAGTKYITVTVPKVSGVGYEIYRSTSKTGTYTKVKTTTSNTFKNTGLTSGKTYYYKVRTYKTINDKKVYSAYTAVKYAKAK